MKHFGSTCGIFWLAETVVYRKSKIKLDLDTVS